jgi:phosphoribosylamine-glycine ligase
MNEAQQLLLWFRRLSRSFEKESNNWFRKHNRFYLFHAGTKLENGQVVSNGGRVLTVTLEIFEEAIKKSYQNISYILIRCI